MKKMIIIIVALLLVVTLNVYGQSPSLWKEFCPDPGSLSVQSGTGPNGESGNWAECIAAISPTPPPTNTAVPPTQTPTNTAVPPMQTPTNTAVPPTATAENCDPWPSDVPAGSLPGQPPPAFCLIKNSGPGTEQSGQNSWYDDFNHGLSFADFEGTQYQIFNEIGAWRTIYWRHANHWMVDMAPHPQNTTYGYDRGISMLRPDQTFKFENGKLVVETTVAAGHDAYIEKAWPEIVISTGAQPLTDANVDLYAYDQFPEYWTLGCRLQNTRVPICALRANDGTPPQPATRIWEMSFWQHVGTYNFGGGPFGDLANYWNVCEVTDPDIVCRDHFRLELTATSLKLFVNGHLYFEQSGIPALPNELLTGNLYIYLASTHVNHPADTVRYHWDDIVINNQAPPA